MRNRLGWILATLGVALLLVAGISDLDAQGGSALRVGSPAPRLTGFLPDSTRFDGAALNGHPAIVSFWASWCAPCREELPKVARLAGDFASRGVVWAAVSLDEGSIGMQSARRFLASQRLAPDHFFLAGEESLGGWRISTLPTLYVVDRSGRIAAGFSGVVSERTLRKALEAVSGSSEGTSAR